MPAALDKQEIKINFFKISLIVFACLTLWRLIGAAVLPVIQDEAYYFAWATQLDMGYFDHPPLVALMGLTSIFADGSVLIARLGTVFTATLMFFFSAKLFWHIGLKERKAFLAALVLCNCNLIGLVFGFLTTPDTLQMLSWTWALYEAFLAIKYDRRRWLIAGAAAGIGLLGKYTMVLIAPVFFWGMLKSDKKALSTKWPYLGGVVALIIFLPHVAWNANNDWITMKFQLRHGVAADHEVFVSSTLPLPLEPDVNSPEAKLASAFDKMELEEEEEERAKTWFDPIFKSINRYFGFYGSQLALWGVLLVPLVSVWWRRRKMGTEKTPTTIDEKAVPLLKASIWVPLIFFGIFAIFSKVEANWAGVYIIGASAFIASYKELRPKSLAFASLANIAIVLLLLAHAHSELLPTRAHRDRILLETHGYQELAQKSSELAGPVFADSYQLVSMLRFYDPARPLMQWPGITRTSEFIRRKEFTPVNISTLKKLGRFWMITTDRTPPRIEDFSATSMTQVRDCKGENLQYIPSTQASLTDERCKKPIHKWFLVSYDINQDL